MNKLSELKLNARQRHKLTIDDILQELEDARQKALNAETPQCSAAVTATMSKAKLLGLDKQVIEHKGILTPPIFHFNPVAPTKDDIKQAMRELQEEY